MEFFLWKLEKNILQGSHPQKRPEESRKPSDSSSQEKCQHPTQVMLETPWLHRKFPTSKLNFCCTVAAAGSKHADLWLDGDVSRCVHIAYSTKRFSLPSLCQNDGRTRCEKPHYCKICCTFRSDFRSTFCCVNVFACSHHGIMGTCVVPRLPHDLHLRYEGVEMHQWDSSLVFGAAMHAMQVLRNTMHRALNPRSMTPILVLHGVPVLPVNSTWPIHFSICFKLFRVLTQIWCARTRCVDPTMVCLSLVKQDCQESNPIIYVCS